ncbi:hypothetical protein C2D64_11750 [Listeria ivanovii]|nr:hypothetical protein JL58_12730 [Listeria ivanovii subsp. londoniensis]MBM5608704.1 hypothetical protein [Listeria ivanovii]AIS63611.1 hypothetical protein JL53_13220 [Listeria ivanovii subsp. londoniensis]MBM5636742.1 hypothetical protein [Listeria ivanovii]MBM5706343.1 hypothetical protein [Listeria ivanovii]
MEVVENYREKHELMHNPREYIINSGFIIQIFHEDKLFYSLKINEILIFLHSIRTSSNQKSL